MSKKVVDSETVRSVLARMVVSYPQEKEPSRLMTIRRLLKKAESVEEGDSLFAFEKSQFDEDNIATLMLRREKNHILLAKKGYEELDIEFLSWRKKSDNLPAFVVINIDSQSHTFRISVEPLEGGYNFEFEPRLPNAVVSQYDKVLSYLCEYAEEKGWTEISITAKVNGFIGDRVLRQRVINAKNSGVFDQIFIVAEANEWVVNRTSFIKDDPIIVGWIEQTEQMFVIGTFDLTPLEEHILTSYKK